MSMQMSSRAVFYRVTVLMKNHKLSAGLCDCTFIHHHFYLTFTILFIIYFFYVFTFYQLHGSMLSGKRNQNNCVVEHSFLQQQLRSFWPEVVDSVSVGIFNLQLQNVGFAFFFSEKHQELHNRATSK